MPLSTILTGSTDPDDMRMTLGEHLEELRSRLIRALVGLVVGAGISYYFISYIVAFITWPIFTILRNHGYPAEIKIFNPAESFMMDLKVAIIVGIIISAPYSMMQIWGFIAAGLYPHERRWVRGFAPVSIALFFIGAAFLLLVVSPLLLSFLLTYRTELPDVGRYMPRWLVPQAQVDPISEEPELQEWQVSQPILSFMNDPENPPEGVPWLNSMEHEIRVRFGESVFVVSHLTQLQRRNRVVPDMRIAEVIPFILQLAAAFGIGFQVPVVVSFLAAVGIASAADMAKMRRYVYFGMALGSAVITPPDPGSMMFLLLPMILLYEAGLVTARMLEKRRPVS